ncbi:inorganic phosphate transporter [Haloferax sp. KTX1]|uniref:inorganic phosphate transporter n=1 Tax=Haloferax sp. KTX1 TaxID=2600597 RepID=UPI0011DDC6E6|nr:inorganic phosphate transporter [Haloferax sp. KTX1]
MIGALLGLGLVVAVFAGINTGGSAIGESFGPSVGSDVLTVRTAAVLMSVSVVFGGWFVGRHVIETLGHGFVPSQYFTLPAAIGVLLFTGFGILLGNLREVSVSTSETAVGAVAGLGAALGVLNWETVGVVVSWWVVSPIVAFWISGVVGRYFYDRIESTLDLSSDSRSTIGKILVIAIACYMGFSAGASNVANAVAPLVGAGVMPSMAMLSSMDVAVLLGAGAMAIGSFYIGPRTMTTVGNDLTNLTLEGALIVEIIAATIITGLSWAGIPASLAITAITCVIGLGWGRATRHVPVEAAAGLEGLSEDEEARVEADSPHLFDPDTTRHVVTTWMLSPTVAFVLAFVVFKVAAFVGFFQV